MDLIFGGVVHLLCMNAGIRLNLRWLRLSKDSKWTSMDTMRFFMNVTGTYYLYATLGVLFSNGSMMLSTTEWYLCCTFHGFTSGPLYAYGRSVLAETTMVGYEGLYVGLMTAASLVLSLVMPIAAELVALDSANATNVLPYLFLEPMVCFLGSAVLWWKYVRIDQARTDNKTYLAKIKALDMRKEEFREALRERLRRQRQKEQEGWMANKKELEQVIFHLEWQKENEHKASTIRNYDRAREVLVRHYQPCECGSCTCCASKRCYCTFSNMCGCIYNAAWYNYCRLLNHRRREILAQQKAALSWKKEEALAGKIMLSLIHNEIVGNNETMLMRWRKKWMQRTFLPEADSPIVRSAVLRGAEAWEEKLANDEKKKVALQTQFELEGTEKYFFSSSVGRNERMKWGMLSSESDSSSEGSEGEEKEEEAEAEESEGEV
jgi:hypothetical protein